MEGEGILTIKESGDEIQGNWYKGEIIGPVIIISTNGDRYEGSQLNGKRHNWGTMQFINKNIYTGSWEKGEMNG